MLTVPADQPTMRDWLAGGSEEATARARKRAGALQDLSHFSDDYFLSPDRRVDDLKIDEINFNVDTAPRVPNREQIVKLLEEGNNIVLRGIGSKINYLDDITKRCTREGMLVFRVPSYKKVNFSKALTMLVSTITQEQISPLPKNLNKLGFFLDDYLMEHDVVDHVVAVVDLIEMLDNVALEVLTRLSATCDKFHLIASVERSDFLQILGLPQASTWEIPCHTMEDYGPELRKVKTKAARTRAEFVPMVISVLHTITAEQRDFFYAICEHQQNNSHGITEEALVLLATSQLCAFNLVRIRAHLREFTDHKIIGERANKAKFVKVSSHEELQEILDTKTTIFGDDGE